MSVLSRRTTFLFCAWMSVAVIGCHHAHANLDVVDASVDRDAATHDRHVSPADDHMRITRSNAHESQPRDCSSESNTCDWADVEDGWLRAEAWPSTDMETPWLALEEGEGVFVTDVQGHEVRFIFSSRRESLPSKGVIIDLPADITPEQRPSWISVRASATPIHITRSAWPSIQPLMHAIGRAEVPVGSGSRIFVRFQQVERVSLLEIRMGVQESASRFGVGRIKLVGQKTEVPPANVYTIPLDLSSDSMLPPEKSGILGIDEEMSLPHQR